ncbi:MAG TPA: VOC family protein [Bryobacteraceae bacterium]|jgi:catechol 2,3-dioxygenase-like lactoylglutathione lyase family enzyme
MTRLEHANLCVRDVDGMIRFLVTAFPEFRVRHDATEADGSRWVHVGTDDTYIALQSSRHERIESLQPYSGSPGLNHLGYEVDDVEAIVTRLCSAGYADTTVRHPHRKRVYFHDPEGNEWEFVQYFTNDAAARNDYGIPNLPSAA